MTTETEIETLKAQLKASEKALYETIAQANSALKSLSEQEDRSNGNIRFFAKLRSVCYDCWNDRFFIEMGDRIETPHPTRCVRCGRPIDTVGGCRLAMPPSFTPALEMTNKAIDQYLTTTKKAPFPQSGAHAPNLVENIRIALNRRLDYRTGDTYFVQETKEFLQLVKLQEESASKLAEQIKAAKHAWSAFLEKHEKELKKVLTAVEQLDSDQRKILERKALDIDKKLEELGGPMKRIRIEDQCAICSTRPRDIAFQCGHRCCDGCSKALSNCHICRKRIVRKIKLYE